MRKPYPSSSLFTLAGLCLVGSCSIIAEVDRTKIPQDDGAAADGGQGQGGTSTGGMSGKAGMSGASGTATSGASGTGQGGSGGDAGGGGQGNEGGDMGGAGTGAGTSGAAGQGGEGGMPTCGDGDVNSGEECDDDNLMDTDGCDQNCDEEPGWNCTGVGPSVCSAAMCGDGIVAGAENCDDGNSLACGTCAGDAAGTTAGCLVTIAPAAATGTITPVGNAELIDTETLVIGDGITSVTFEFDNDATFTNGRTAIVYNGGDDAAAIGTAIAAAINASSLTITATGTTTVTLTHETLTAVGNQLITGTVINGGFMATGMSGGRARNCPMAVGCKVDADCASGDCNNLFECTN